MRSGARSKSGSSTICCKSRRAVLRDTCTRVITAHYPPRAMKSEVSERRSEVHLVGVAPAPGLSRLEGLDDRMLRFVIVLPRMPVRGVVAAADVAARQAESQMDPSVTRAETFLATFRCARRDVVDHVEMAAAAHGGARKKGRNRGQAPRAPSGRRRGQARPVKGKAGAVLLDSRKRELRLESGSPGFARRAATSRRSPRTGFSPNVPRWGGGGSRKRGIRLGHLERSSAFRRRPRTRPTDPQGGEVESLTDERDGRRRLPARYPAFE